MPIGHGLISLAICRKIEARKKDSGERRSVSILFGFSIGLDEGKDSIIGREGGVRRERVSDLPEKPGQKCPQNAKWLSSLVPQNGKTPRQKDSIAGF